MSQTVCLFKLSAKADSLYGLVLNKPDLSFLKKLIKTYLFIRQ